MPVGSEHSQYMFILQNLIKAKFQSRHLLPPMWDTLLRSNLLSFARNECKCSFKKAGVPCQPGLAKVRRVRYDSA